MASRYNTFLTAEIEAMIYNTNEYGLWVLRVISDKMGVNKNEIKN